LVTASGRAWLNGERLTRGTVRSGDDIRVEDTYFRFVCGEDLPRKFHETIYHLTITDFPTGLGNARAFGEAFQQHVRRAKSRVVVAVIGVESESKTAISSHDLLAGVAERVRNNRPRSWYAARVGELEIGLVVADENAKSVKDALDQWLIGCDAPEVRLWQGVAEADPTSPVDAALASARYRRRTQSG
jgi:GGDEF domain-containing protein